MTIIDIINKKRKRKELTREEIQYVIKGFLDKSIKKYQMSSLLMAITLNGMSDREIIDLTDAMISSGDVLNLSKIEGVIVDKHSTGGLGDNVTLVLAPLLASLGINVAKTSNKGLFYQVGTIDKLESIEGFKTDIDKNNFIKQLDNINVSIVNQFDNLVPVDKKMYTLRQITGTVESIPLIASSIMSRKIASGSDIILIDIKVGNGTVIKNIKDARELARLMVNIGKAYRKPTICLISSLEEPLGYAIGSALEVEEAINTLKGSGPSDLLEVVMTLCSVIVGALKKISNSDAKILLFKQLNNGKAYKKFQEMIEYQKGKIESIKISDKVFSIKSDKSGYINRIDIVELGEIARKIGAVKGNFDDKIDYEVGLVLNKKVGDYIEKEEELVKVYLKDKDISISEILNCFLIEKELKGKQKLILDIIK